MKDIVLLANGFINVPSFKEVKEKASTENVGTILSNFAFYGFIPSKMIVDAISAFSETQLAQFWAGTEKVLKEYFKEVLTAKNGVVYKNFPEEVLSKSEGEYWLSQILMYWGVPSEIFAEEEKLRPKSAIDLSKLKVLKSAKADTLQDIFNSYIIKKVSLTPKEQEYLDVMLESLDIKSSDISDSSFKMNGVLIGKKVFERGGIVEAKNATDIIRFAAAISDQDSTLKERINFFKFSRAQRKLLLRMLCSVKHYEEDFAARPESFKALLKALRPGDYSWAKPVSEMYDALYNKNVHSFAAKVNRSQAPWELLKTRPGIFLRRFHEIYSKNSDFAIINIKEVFDSLTVYQLLKFKNYVKNVNNNKFIIARAKSLWSKAKLIENKKQYIAENHIVDLVSTIDCVLSAKLAVLFPNGVIKGEMLDTIALPSNDQEVSVGRGTVYTLPENVKFIRTASFWENKVSNHSHNFWFDNGWNFIHESENFDAVVCWNSPGYENGQQLAIFSGDPTIANSSSGEATQVIDINLEGLEKAGYKYAVWNVLSYNNIVFNDAEKVFGCMQFLEDQKKGEIFDPSKVNIQFDLKGNAKNKMVVLLDVVERKIIYLDMAFPKICVQSALENKKSIREFLPAVIEHLNSIPTVADLIENVKDGEIPFLYSDKDVSISGDAYVFKHENPDNEFNQLDLQKLID